MDTFSRLGSQCDDALLVLPLFSIDSVGAVFTRRSSRFLERSAAKVVVTQNLG